MNKTFYTLLNTLIVSCLCAQVPNKPQIPSGPAQVCPGGNFTYQIPPTPGATFYAWLAPVDAAVMGETQFPVLISAPQGEEVTVSYGYAGGKVCVAAGNDDGLSEYSCKTISVAPLPPTVLPMLTLCAEDLPYFWQGIVLINQSGTQTFSHTYTSVHGCDSVVKQTVKVLPPILRVLPTIYACTQDTGCYEYLGLTLCQEGFFTDYFTSYLGCDSVVTGFFYRIPLTCDILPLQPVLNCITGSVLLKGQTNFPNPSCVWRNQAGMVVGNSLNYSAKAPGTYTLTLYGPNGCSASSTVTVADPGPKIAILPIGPPNADCQNPETTLQTTATPSTVVYSWSSPTGFNSQLQNPIVTQTGTYTVTVTDYTNGCTGTKSVFVVLETRRDTQSMKICMGGSYSGYNQPGMYVDTLVTHPCGCFDIRVLQLDYAPAFDPMVVVEPDNGTGSGTASVQVSGGNGPFRFLWSTGDTLANIGNLATGLYLLTVKDVYGCSQTVAVKVPFDPNSAPPIRPVSAFSVFPNPAAGQLWVDMPAAGTLQLFDALGETVLGPVRAQEGSVHFDLHSIPGGVYYVVWEDAPQGTVVRKVLIYK